METRSSTFFWRELVACACIALLLPSTVYRGVRLFVKPAGQAADIKEIRRNERTPKQEKVMDAFYKHRGQIFLRAAVVVGIAAMALGIFTGAAPLGTSLIVGGCILIMRAYAVNWQYLSDAAIFISLLIAVLLLGGALWWYSRRQ